MIHIVSGKSRKQNTDYFLRAIKERIRIGLPGAIWIVPEQYSFEAELRLCTTCGERLSRYAEVLSFTRLSDVLTSKFGGSGREMLDEGGRMLTLISAIEAVQSKLKFYGTAKSKPESIKALLKQIEEFKTSCITPDALRKASLKFTGIFAQKLEELAIIYESYMTACALGKADPIDLLYLAADILYEQDYADGKTFYIDGFSDFTELQFKILKSICAHKCDVWISLVCDETDNEIFALSRRTIDSLKKLAKESGSQIDNIPLYCVQSGNMPEHLFDFVDISEDSTRNINIFCAENTEMECEAAVSEAYRLLMSGERCREISIVCTNETYYKKLISLFREFNLPCYVNRADSLIQEPIVEALFSAINASQSYDENELFSFLLSPVGILDEDEIDLLQNYVHMWHIKGSEWSRTFIKSIHGYEKTSSTKEDIDTLDQLNRARSTVYVCLSEFYKNLKASKTVEEMVLAVYQFLKNIHFEEKINVQIQNCESMQRAFELQQIYPGILKALEQVYLVLGNSERSISNFIAILKEILTQYDLKTVPAMLDAITIGNFASVRYKYNRNLIVLGAVEGKMPEISSSVGILNEKERIMLRCEADIMISQGSDDVIFREYSSIYDVFKYAENHISLVYSGEHPANIIKKVSRYLKVDTFSRDLLIFNNRRIANRIAENQETNSKLLANAEISVEYENTVRSLKRNLTELSTAAAEHLYQKSISISASQVNTVALCQFRYFLQYGLNLQEKKEAVLDSQLFGTFVHYVLEKTISDGVRNHEDYKTMSEQIWDGIKDRNTEDFLNARMPEYKEEDEQFQYFLKQSIDEISYILKDSIDELRLSEFIPSQFEMKFGSGKDTPAIEIWTDLGKATLIGTVDRIDCYQDHDQCAFRIIDYKTGAKSFDYADIEKGLGLQMLLYLFALKKGDWAGTHQRNKPAGVLYVPAREVINSFNHAPNDSEIEKSELKNVRRSGLLLNDNHVLHAMESYSDVPIYLPIDGKGKTSTEYLATDLQMNILQKYVEKTLSGFVREIFGGSILQNPVSHGQQGACTYCPFKSCCASSCGKIEERQLRKMNAEQFWNRIEEKKSDD